MSRTLAERAKDWHWWFEEALHVVIGAIAASVLWIGSPILAGTLAALWAAGLREWEQRPVDNWGDLAVDVACTALGGLAMGLAIWAVTR